jgi:hypothetical protein
VEAVPFVVPATLPVRLLPLKVKVPVNADDAAVDPLIVAMVNVAEFKVLPLGEPVKVPLIGICPVARKVPFALLPF